MSNSTSKSFAPLWFAVHGRTGHERSIGSALAGMTFEVFLPSRRVKRQWSDRIKQSTIPLFPGYVFCRFDIRDKLNVLKTPGVISIVGIGKEPLPITDEEVRNIRIMVDSGISTYPWPYIRVGRTIAISEGPLRGLHAIVLEEDASNRKLIVSIELLNRSIAIDIPPEWAISLEPTSSDSKLVRFAQAA